MHLIQPRNDPQTLQPSSVLLNEKLLKFVVEGEIINMRWMRLHRSYVGGVFSVLLLSVILQAWIPSSCEMFVYREMMSSDTKSDMDKVFQWQVMRMVID